MAYFFVSGEPGYVAGQRHGLIAATADQPSQAWSNIVDVPVGTTLTAIGTGQANTTAIVNQGATSGAAHYCDDLVEGGHSDWYLPSKDELNKLYPYKDTIGGFGSSAYLSSSENSATLAWGQNFATGYGGQYGYTKNWPNLVRAVRSF